jgi:hypothetical protein
MQAIIEALLKNLMMKCGNILKTGNYTSMKITKNAVLFALLIIVILFIFGHLIYPSRDQKLIKTGNLIINKIENYKNTKGVLPSSLNDIGVEEKLEGPLYYQKIDSTKYLIWFGTTLGESYTYDSDKGKWQEK